MLLRTLALTGAVTLACAFGARAEMVTYHATLNAAQEVPPTNSPATGSVTAVLDTATHKLTVDMTFKGFTDDVTAAHIHGPAAAGANAGVMVPLGTAPKSPVHVVATLTTDQEKDMAAGKTYVNVHSKDHPGGAIRGQLTK
jgi:hypothetical protein